jgi:hypothetical protein
VRLRLPGHRSKPDQDLTQQPREPDRHVGHVAVPGRQAERAADSQWGRAGVHDPPKRAAPVVLARHGPGNRPGRRPRPALNGAPGAGAVSAFDDRDRLAPPRRTSRCRLDGNA